MSNHKNILMIRLSAIGDVVRTLPSLYLLRKKFPKSRIVWAIEEKASLILEGNNALDEIIVIPRRSWIRSLKDPLKWFGTIINIIKFLRDIREKRFDTVLDFHSSIKSGIISWSTGAETRIGYTARYSREWNFLFNNVRLPLRKKRISRMERNFTLLKYFHIVADEYKAEISISKDEKNYIDDFLKGENLSSKKKIIIFPGTSKKQAYKKWGSKNYAAIADMCLNDDVGIILGWGPGELDECEKIVSYADRTIALSPPTSLKHLAELIRRCDLFIGGDTAAMHLSCAVGTPCVAIYGPTDPVLNAPWGKDFRIVHDDSTDCSPCRKRRCKKRTCFENITPELVYREVQDLMKSLFMK